MIKSVLFLIGILLAYFGKYLIDLGVFRYIETTGLEKCRLIIPPDGGN
jgi:hypothetical protein